MKRFGYDSYSAFEIAIQSLGRLNKLIMRRQAAHARKEQLNEWVVLGRFFFSSEGAVLMYTHAIPAVVFPHFPSVLSWSDYRKYLKTYTMPHDTLPQANILANIPPTNLVCPECDTGWTIKNCHDTVVERKNLTIDINEYVGLHLYDVKASWKKMSRAVWRLHPGKSVRNALYLWKDNPEGWVNASDMHVVNLGDEVQVDIQTFRHSICYHQCQSKTEQAYFEDIFTVAGYKNVLLTETRNPYCTMEFCPPWFDVTADGIKITIGNWRNRIIIIICNDPRVDFEKICPDCDVTKGADYIHAWGRDMAITYLIMIRKIIFPE